MQSTRAAAPQPSAGKLRTDKKAPDESNSLLPSTSTRDDSAPRATAERNPGNERELAVRTPDGKGGWIQSDLAEEPEGTKLLKQIKSKKKKKPDQPDTSTQSLLPEQEQQPSGSAVIQNAVAPGETTDAPPKAETITDTKLQPPVTKRKKLKSPAPETASASQTQGETLNPVVEPVLGKTTNTIQQSMPESTTFQDPPLAPPLSSIQETSKEMVQETSNTAKTLPQKQQDEVVLTGDTAEEAITDTQKKRKRKKKSEVREESAEVVKTNADIGMGTTPNAQNEAPNGGTEQTIESATSDKPERKQKRTSRTDRASLDSLKDRPTTAQTGVALDSASVIGSIDTSGGNRDLPTGTSPPDGATVDGVDDSQIRQINSDTAADKEPSTKADGKKKKKKKKKESNAIELAAMNEGKKRVRRRTKLLEAEQLNDVKKDAEKADPMYGLSVGNFFILEDVLGKGGFGEARRGRHTVTNKKFAIKLERVADANDSLAEEYKIYQILGQHLGFPRCYFFGAGPKEHNALVMDLLGPSLEDYFRAMERKWSLKTVCMVALQILDRIEYLHSKGFVYSDVKPENFLVGLAEESQDSVIFLIDFGLAQQFKDRDTGKYCYDENMKTHPVGTMRYMSVRSHEGRSLSYRDDLESIGYLMVYLVRGRLPWQGTSIKDRIKKVKAVGLHKKNIAVEELCQGCPQELHDYMKYVKSIQFYAEPRYEKLRNFFAAIMTNNNLVDDGKFDWIGKSFDFAKNKKSDSGIVKPDGEPAEGKDETAAPNPDPDDAALPKPQTVAPEEDTAQAATDEAAVTNEGGDGEPKKRKRRKKRKSIDPETMEEIGKPPGKVPPKKTSLPKQDEPPKKLTPAPQIDLGADPIKSFHDRGGYSKGTEKAHGKGQKGGGCGCC